MDNILEVITNIGIILVYIPIIFIYACFFLGVFAGDIDKDKYK